MANEEEGMFLINHSRTGTKRNVILVAIIATMALGILFAFPLFAHAASITVGDASALRGAFSGLTSHGDTIMLTANIDLGATSTSHIIHSTGKSVTLDLAGYNISYSGAIAGDPGNSAIMQSSNSHLIIENSGDTTNEIYSSKRGVVSNLSGTLTIKEKVRLRGDTNASLGPGTVSFLELPSASNGTLILQGGEIVNDNTDGFGRGYAISLNSTTVGISAKVIIEDGIVTAGAGVAINLTRHGEVLIKGGTVTSSQASATSGTILNGTSAGNTANFVTGSVKIEGGLVENTSTGNAIVNPVAIFSKAHMIVNGGVISALNGNALRNAGAESSVASKIFCNLMT